MLLGVLSCALVQRIRMAFTAVSQHLDQLGDHLQLPIARAGEDDRLEVGVYRLQDDAGVPPGIAVLRLLALVERI